MIQTEIEHPLPATSAVDLPAPPAEPDGDLRRELARAKDKIDNLELALRTSREIGMAIGILMARQCLTADSAWQLLVTASQQTHVKVRDLASEVVYVGALER